MPRRKPSVRTRTRSKPATRFTSPGQIALDPATGNLVEGDFSGQARRVFENLRAVLQAAGTYLTDVKNFPTLNSIYAEVLGDHKPARSTVGVAQLPRGAAVEIDLIAVI